MTWYRRVFVPGGTHFFTVVTYQRRPLFDDALARRCLRQAMAETRKKRPFDIVALCLLPEHLHCVWVLPDNDSDNKTRWGDIKSSFSRSYLEAGGHEGPRSSSRKHRRERGVWNRRFWAHLVMDERDFARHVDYTHYNPAKHGLVSMPAEWPWSTFARYVREGIYPKDWGKVAPDSIAGFECPDE